MNATRLGMMAEWVLAGLAYRRTRTAFTMLGLALVTALMISVAGFHMGYRESLKRSIDSLGFQILITGKGCPHEAATLMLRGGSIPMYIDESVYQQIAGDEEVEDLTRFFMQAVPSPEPGKYQLYVGIDENFLRLKPFVAFQRGSWFTSPESDEVIIGYNVAEILRLDLGDTMEVQGRPLAVRGVLDRLGTQDDGTVFLPLVVAQSLFERRDFLTGIGVRLKDISHAPAFINRVYDLPSTQVITMAQVQSTILNILGGTWAFTVVITGVCLVVTVLGVMNAMLLSVQERRPDMGVLRALGCGAGDLFVLVLAESFLIACGGAALGVAILFVMRAAVEQWVRSVVPFAPSGTLLVMEPGMLVSICAGVVVLGLLGSIYPGVRAATVSPLTSMRGAI